MLSDLLNDYWCLDESFGMIGYDLGGFYNLVEGSGVGYGASGVIFGDSDMVFMFSGLSSGMVGIMIVVYGLNMFLIEVWFNIMFLFGGKIIGFGFLFLGNSVLYDCYIYVDSGG